MKKIPDFKFYAPKEWEKEKLQKWLKLWNIKELLDKPLELDEACKVSEKEDREIAALLRSKVRPFDTRPEVGEIRLLSSDLLDAETLPRYIAIIKKWDDENYLTAPFSIFPISAVQGELETGREHFSLANLELWNAVVAPFVTLKKSWIVDKMSDEELDDAFQVFKFISSGETLPEHLEDRIGSPIFKDHDPRIVYQDEETEVFVPFREVCQEDMYPLFQSISKEIVKIVIASTSVAKPVHPKEKKPLMFPFNLILPLEEHDYQVELLAAAGESSKADCTISVEIVSGDGTHEVDVVFEWNNSEKVTEISLEGEYAAKLYKNNAELIVVFENGDQHNHRFDFEENQLLKLPLKNIPVCGIILSV